MLFGVASPITLLGLLAFSASAVSRFRSSVNSAGAAFSYDYAHHGMDWLQGLCSDHERQSPVNFDVLDTQPTGKMHYAYEIVKSSFELANNGHTFSADFSGLGYGGMTYEENWYNLMNINFHSLSEHTFKGVHYPLEMHLVHKKYNSDDLIIVAVPITQNNESLAAALIQERVNRQVPGGLPEGSPQHYYPPNEKEEFWNPQLQKFMRVALPLINQKSVCPVSEEEPLNLNSFLEGGIYFEYAGSLTSPPCATNVIWLVRRNPVLAAESQIRIMSDNIFQMTADYGNYRAVLPINGRPVATRVGIEETMPPAPDMPSLPIGSFPRTDREFQAMKWARDALRLSKTASDYVYGLDTRLQKAARAHVDALAPDLHIIPTTTPAPAVKEMSPTDMAKTAANMAKAIATAAKQAIHDASEQIAKEAEMAAREAAKEAAVKAGKEIALPTNPPTGPAGAPGAPGAPGAAPAMPPAPAPER
jgi:carbonic anhydrase